MPKKAIDYNNVQFYKIVCKDLSITDCYVGHTTNFTKRKCNHKFCCITENDKDYNLYVYQFIRDHGNWSNWDMILIETGCYENKFEAHRRERELIEQLQSTLNKSIPTRKQKEWYNENKEKRQEYRQDYYNKNKEQIRENQADYRNKNKQEIYQKQNAKCSCSCGGKFTIVNKSKHENSKKHQQYMQQQEQT